MFKPLTGFLCLCVGEIILFGEKCNLSLMPMFLFFLWGFCSLRTGGKVSLQGNMDPCALYATKVSIGIYKQQKSLLKLESFPSFRIELLSKLCRDYLCFKSSTKILLIEFQNKEAVLFLQVWALLVI